MLPLAAAFSTQDMLLLLLLLLLTWSLSAAPWHHS
jgi:hypothetical protein